MDEITYHVGPRILPDGRNMDADVIATHPEVQRRSIVDPVSDGSLGQGYAPGQKNHDGSQI